MRYFGHGSGAMLTFMEEGENLYGNEFEAKWFSSTSTIKLFGCHTAGFDNKYHNDSSASIMAKTINRPVTGFTTGMIYDYIYKKDRYGNKIGKPIGAYMIPDKPKNSDGSNTLLTYKF